MIRVNIVDINEILYKNLIQYCLSFCNEISFHFPGVYDNGKPIDQKEWREYHENIAPLLKTYLNNGAKKTYSKHYAGMKLGLSSIIVKCKITSSIKKSLLERHLFDWTVQNCLPEDVCLYDNEKMRVFSCSHDEYFFIYNETKRDVEFLSNNGYEFYSFK